MQDVMKLIQVHARRRNIEAIQSIIDFQKGPFEKEELENQSRQIVEYGENCIASILKRYVEERQIIEQLAPEIEEGLRELDFLKNKKTYVLKSADINGEPKYIITGTDKDNGILITR